MFSINERFCTIYKMSQLSQEKFAERIKRSRGEVANIIYKKNLPKDNIIRAVCDEFEIREEWLRYGIEPMKAPRSEEEEIAEMVGSALTGSSKLKRAVVRMICSKSEEELAKLEAMLRELYESIAE